MDSQGIANIALAEGHHLAWLLGYGCALPPGAFGTPPGASRDAQKPFHCLKSGEFVETRSTPGCFKLTLFVRNLKSSSEQVAEKTGYHNRSVDFHIKLPQNHHKLLNALRSSSIHRDALENYIKLDELLNNPAQTWTGRCRCRLVLRSGRFVEQPASATDLTECLHDRGHRAGYTKPITFYFIWRRARTNFAKVDGVDSARHLICHESDPRTFEEFYLDKMSTTDVSSLAFGENDEARVAEIRRIPTDLL